MSNVNNMSYVNNLSYVCRLYELYELLKSYEYFYESLKVTCFLFLTNLEYFSQYLRMKNLNYKNENIERKYLKNMQKN